MAKREGEGIEKRVGVRETMRAEEGEGKGEEYGVGVRVGVYVGEREGGEGEV